MGDKKTWKYKRGGEIYEKKATHVRFHLTFAIFLVDLFFIMHMFLVKKLNSVYEISI